MGDVFKEQIVKKESDKKDMLIRAGAILAVVIIAFLSIIIPILQPFAIFIVFAAAFGVYYLFTFLNVEYEYIYTNGELDIDTIYSRSRRKRVFSGYVKDFEIMAHVDDKDHASDFNSAAETKNYSSGKTKPNTYAFLVSYKGKHLKVIIEPNEVMIQAFSTVLTPRKFFKK